MPGRGLPLICSGSYDIEEAGGRGHELVVDALDGVHGLEGEVRPGDIGRYPGMYAGASPWGNGISGAESMIDGALE